ncbi:MAG: primosomal protein N' [Zetaproteobacteria bacterium CG12_big_fil_rev_8_21_14_0_65_54_13]|nr:MAG: primosomal protein N' [Zetaproteobacteria bacterium CG12_big_fil_rev_8_21_14_0_65_54_13]PIX55074.1 MAG: primosomal protein N' [Zetaproteobacteria bacterium CG_4_10_14_3_um_filter_54_28]PJA30208.1 MAG: primosomal protein N' [Zetaproteobacteria bacterium CG_4_9_14_3_um_filter_54_145]
MLCIEVAVFSPLPGCFSYSWPPEFGEAVVGMRVQVPFGNGTRTGVVLRLSETMPDNVELKPVADRLDREPLYDAARVQWVERVRRYYLSSQGDAWQTVLAWAAHDQVRSYRCPDVAVLAAAEPALAAAFSNRRALSLKTIAARVEPCALRHSLNAACQAGVLEEVIHEPLLQQNENTPPPLTLTDAQAAALQSLVDARGFQPFLLFGRTGSGKTEVYLRAATRSISRGGRVLVLVPEIGLTPMWIARLQSRFARVAVWHSALSERDRLAVRQHLAQTDILIGTRSALFLPLPDLAMIVVDEEHDNSFKQQDGMAYSARDMAVLLAQQLDIPIVLGSATPSLESWRQAQTGLYKRIDLPSRIADHTQQIKPEIIDMRVVDGPVSPALLAAMQQTLAAGDQAILFLNRRGYSPSLQCTACGDVPQCPACSLSLTLHRRAGQLRCHSCGFIRRVPRSCESCGEAALMPMGEGTERIEEWLQEHLPTLRFSRFDRDVVTSHARLSEILAAFESRELDCLLGTQMLVKGHDFPHVTLVGVINADQGMNMPDFRAGERWWQQMTQVTGRAGRGEKAGRMLIQTRMPEAAWLTRIAEAQAEATMTAELELREMLQYPPFARWVRVVFSAMRAERADQAATAFAESCRTIPELMVSGPMPCVMERLAGRFRFEVLLRDTTRQLLPWKLMPVLESLKIPSGVRRRVDVDPQDMM